MTGWVSQVFRDAADRVARDPYAPNSSLARGATRRATIRPVRAVLAPLVHPATPPSGTSGVDVVGVRVESHPDDVHMAAMAQIRAELAMWARTATYRQTPYGRWYL